MKAYRNVGEVYVKLEMPRHMRDHARYVANHLPREGVSHEERYAESLIEQAEDWIKELTEFMRDHRSRDDLRMSSEMDSTWGCGECGEENKTKDAAEACCVDAQAPVEPPHA